MEDYAYNLGKIGDLHFSAIFITTTKILFVSLYLFLNTITNRPHVLTEAPTYQGSLNSLTGENMYRSQSPHTPDSCQVILPHLRGIISFLTFVYLFFMSASYSLSSISCNLILRHFESSYQDSAI